MPPKRKQAPQDNTDPVTKPTTKAAKTNNKAAATEKPAPAAEKKKAAPPAPKAPADFGSAFASLFEPVAVAPKPAAPAPVVADKKKAAAAAAPAKDTKKADAKKPADAKKADGKKGDVKDKKEEKKGGARDALGRGDRELAAATSKFQQAKEKEKQKRREAAEATAAAEAEGKKKEAQIVVTAQRNDVEAKMKLKSAMLQKQKEKEKDMLLEKDHVKPEFNDLEKKISRIATKGVVTLFNAVYEQQAKLEEIRANKTLLSHQQDQLIDSEAQQGFLDLLKQSAAASGKSTKPDFEAVVPSGKKQMPKADQKLVNLKNQQEFDFEDIKDILGSEGEDSDLAVEDTKAKGKKGKKQEDEDKKKKAAKAPAKGKKQAQQNVPDFLQDDYIMKKRTMKDWENDSDSSADDL